MKGIEIPFGAKDSELCGWEYTIPEGMEAVVENGKVIVGRKESEDEKIRKELIEYLTHRAEVTGFIDEDKDCKRWIAYLEKQKEQPMSAEEVLIRAGLKPYRDGNQWCVLAGGNIQEGICGFGDTIDEALYQFLMEVLKIQKEQKPAARENDFVSKPKNSVEILKHYLTWATTEEENCPYSWKELADAIKDGIKALEEQQPAEWSEEDEEIEKAIESVIHVYGKTQGEFISGYDMDTLIFHLRAVFHRNNSWNDKDKNVIVDILRGLHKGILYKEAEEIADDILKSLRPSWKPSEEQMQYLLAVINDPNNIGAESCYMTIKSLYNDLKKL